MKHNNFFRFGGTVTAAVMLLSQVAAMPGSAAAPAPKGIDACDYVLETDGKKVERGTPVEFSVSELGVPAGTVVKEVWVDISADTSKSLPTMPGCRRRQHSPL